MKNRNYLLLASLFIISFIYSCGNKEVTTSNISDFYQYISAFSNGEISKNESIIIKLKQKIPDIEKIKKETLFEFSPSIKGTVSISDAYTIEFIPDEALKSGEIYSAKLLLNKIFSVDKSLSEFVFKFRVKPLVLSIRTNGLQTIDKKTLQLQKLSGEIVSSDNIKLDKLKKLITAKLGNSNLHLKWLESKNNHFPFIIDSITRIDEEQVLNIQGDVKNLGAENNIKKKVNVPSINDFTIQNVLVVHENTPYIKVNFSDPLSTKQQYNGLISLSNYYGRFKISVQGNSLYIYPTKKITGKIKFHINNSVKNILGKNLSSDYSQNLSFELLKPQVKIANKGVILPNSEEGLIYAFEAVGLKAVDFEVTKIFENNILQFLQENNLSGNYQLRRVGKVIFNKKIKLTDDIDEISNWNRYSIDLAKYLQVEPGAIYSIKVRFRKSYTTFDCASSNNEETTYEKEGDDSEASYWDYYEDNDYYYDWEDRKNPCKKAYYQNSNFISQNILASNIGLIAKKGEDKKIKVVVTNLLDTKPISGADIKLYNYQQQVIGEETSSSDGFASFNVPEKEEPYFVIATSNKESSFIKLDNAYSLSFSRFNVGGKKISNGLKGFIYTERGVWRPGDSIYLSFILNDNANPLPEDHPIICEVNNPLGKRVFKQVQNKNSKNFYLFAFNTESEATTGTYYAKISIGKKTFSKPLKIETVKPNRLKIKFNVEKNALERNMTSNADIHVEWLHGAIGKNMKVDVKANIIPTSTKFEKYKDFTFDDKTKSISARDFNIFNGKTNQEGDLSVPVNISFGSKAPGFMKANFLIKAFEPGGDFSISTKSIPYYPYQSYVGLKLPKGDKTRHMLLTDKEHKIEAVVVDKDGTPVMSTHRLKFSFYKINWRWWWDVSSSSVSNYSFSNNAKLLSSKVVETNMGKANWNIKVKYPDWGRYLVRIKDETSGHSCSKVVYVDWPGWAGRAQRENPEGATMLIFSTDKTKYNVGDKAELVIPGSEGSRALVSIENSSSVLEQFWVECKKGENKVPLDIKSNMVPNVFINISMIQPHATTANDLPIRMYGVVPIDVINPETKLKPILKMPDELESDADFTVKVSEANKKEMTYTIAVVDDGLLDLTNFRTPNPWNSFFAHEALGVRTYDYYDDVIGAYGGELQKLLAIGGDDELPEKGRKEASRFPPVVKFMGPFTLKKGKTNSHKIHMPKYVGSVRTMVIAGNKKAYGSAEKTLKVKKPLMLLATLPRVLGPTETVSLPINIFVGKSDIKNVKITVETNPLIKVEGNATKTINFSGTGDKTIFYNLKVANTIGIGTVKITAKSGNYKSDYEVELNVRYPNPLIAKSENHLLNKGEEFTFNYTPFGLEGTNTAYLEVSNLPGINLEKRLNYLIQYPHGCIEQTTSSVFPQLYVENILDLTQEKKDKIKTNIEKGISRIASFQVSSGGFSYWPGQSEANIWGSNYAGHFLIEAKKAGYEVPAGMLRKWKRYQKSRANQWSIKSYDSDLMQAYRLYTLALNGTPEKSAMNRLKENKTLTNIARWQLAAAYAVLGKNNIAKSLIESSNTDVKDYVELSGTFGSALRDKAIILEAFNKLKDKEKGFEIYKDIADLLSSQRWYNTQAVAYSLMSASQFIANYSTTGRIAYEYSIGGGKVIKASTSDKISSNQLAIAQNGTQNIKIKNTTEGTLYAQFISKGKALMGKEESESSNLGIKINYFDMDNNPITVENMEQGTDFYALVKVSNTGIKTYKELALTQIFPSGWEIINTRLTGNNLSEFGSPKYRDIRDDRVYTYFDLGQGQSRKFKVLLNASYTGTYYMPPLVCEAMYDANIHALKKGEWVKIEKNN